MGERTDLEYGSKGTVQGECEEIPVDQRLLSEQRIKNVVSEYLRQKTVKDGRGEAFSILIPVLNQLATKSKEWEDTSGFDAGQMDEIDPTNRFLVGGDYDASCKKAIDYLLQQKGSNLDNIAKDLLARRKMEGYRFDAAVTLVRDLLRSKMK